MGYLWHYLKTIQGETYISLSRLRDISTLLRRLPRESKETTKDLLQVMG